MDSTVECRGEQKRDHAGKFKHLNNCIKVCTTLFKQNIFEAANKWSKATSVRGVPYTAAHLGSILNFAIQPRLPRFIKEPKYAAFKVTPLTEVVLDLTLSGRGQGTFTLMSLIDQILSAEFFSKNSKLFWM